MRTNYTTLLLLLLTCVGYSLTAQEQVTTLEPVADNTIYEENDNSNGVGVYLFAGATNNNNARRALVRFDLTAIPAGATITSVDLQLTANRGESSDIAVHRLLASWGEGTSEASGNQGMGGNPSDGDATWNFRFFQDSSWVVAGGEFVDQVSATATATNGQRTSWVSEGLVADVQQWVNDSTSNAGWILIGPEDVRGSAMRMGSREGSTPPELIVTYETTTTTIPVIPAQDLQLTVRPNPAGDQLWVDWAFSSQPQQLSVTVQTVLGQPLKQLTLTPATTGQQMIPVTSLTTGWYLVTVRTETGTRSERFYKQ